MGYRTCSSNRNVCLYEEEYSTHQGWLPRANDRTGLKGGVQPQMWLPVCFVRATRPLCRTLCDGHRQCSVPEVPIQKLFRRHLITSLGNTLRLYLKRRKKCCVWWHMELSLQGQEEGVTTGLHTQRAPDHSRLSSTLARRGGTGLHSSYSRGYGRRLEA